MILTTEDHHQLMENIATKCAAQLSLIPPVPSSSASHASADSHLQAGEVDADTIFHRNGKQSSKRDSVLLSVNFYFVFGNENYAIDQG